MNFLECIRVALTGLAANKMRSFLTMLGVIIGVGAIVAIVAIAEGDREKRLARIEAMGSNVVYVFSGSQRRGAVSFGFGSMQTLTLSDSQAIGTGCPSVVRVNPEVRQSAQVKYQNKNTSCSIQGVGADWLKVRKFAIARGRMFTERELKGLRTVGIIGPTTAKNLFAEANPVGRRVRIGGVNFEIIGQTIAKGTQEFMDPDDQVVVPVTTAMRRLFGLEYIRSIACESRTAELIPKAIIEIEQLMRRRHNLGPASDNDFVIRDQAEFMAQREEEANNSRNLLAGIAMVSLFVGGIGIMNIMLVSVTERTREIGIRKALGAKYSDILFQFMIESITLSGTGGLLGIGAGILASYVLTYHFEWTLFISPAPLAMSFIFAMAVGLFFGVYPARKAALLDPIEALRYE